MTDKPDVVIVGAGAAGVGAARRLAGTGLSAVMLEAMARPGGRAWTHAAAGVPLDLGCGWLHSADRNPWTRIAEETGFAVARGSLAGARQPLYHSSEWEAGRRALAQWRDRLAKTLPPSDRAADALEPGDLWTAYLQAVSGFMSGDDLERVSARDYLAYDQASTGNNWRVPAGYGTLVAASLPATTRLCLSTPVKAVTVERRGVAVETPAGTLHARAAILTVSTSVLASGTIAWPTALDEWRDAAARLPLGRNEKLFFEIVGHTPFEPDTHVIGDLHDAATGAYSIRPLGRPVIECFLGGAGARAAIAEGVDAAFARAADQLGALFGSAVRHALRPLMASDWAGTATVGGAYSYAMPGQAGARIVLARCFDERLFFAGEATHPTDFSTAHGAYESGIRAAEEVVAALANRSR